MPQCWLGAHGIQRLEYIAFHLFIVGCEPKVLWQGFCGEEIRRRLHRDIHMRAAWVAALPLAARLPPVAAAAATVIVRPCDCAALLEV